MTGGSIQRVRPVLGTFVAVRCSAACDSQAVLALESAFRAVSRVETLMHPTRAGSDVAALNRCVPGAAVRLDHSTWQVLELSRRLSEASGGNFDPCLPTAAGRIADVDLVEPGLVVCRARVAIDLGGIAKGFAVDRAVTALIDAGCSDGEVNAGGDLRVFGPSMQSIRVRTSEGEWSIAVRDRALAVSDLEQSGRPAEHRGYYNRNRSCDAPGRMTRVAMVAATSAAVADALTKCVLLSDAPEDWPSLRRLLARFDASVPRRLCLAQ
jgi:thiamine biosynthesis lipoprotein